MKLSVVIPTFNEAPNVDETVRRLKPVLASLTSDFEIMFVDDGSTDRTRERLEAIIAASAHVKAVFLTRNFGHQRAVSAGLEHVGGDVVAVMDADLQDPPEVLPELVARWKEGYAVAYGVRRKRKENALKRLGYHGFYRLLGRTASIEIPLDAGDFCVMDRRVVDFINLMPERHRFVRGLRAWIGLRQIGVEYERDARQAGTPKYTVRGLVALASDGIVSFSTRPLRLATKLGFIIAGLAFFLAAFHFGKWLFGFADAPPGFLSIFIGMTFLFGVQFLFIGILGEYIGRIHSEVKARPTFLVDRVVGFDESRPPMPNQSPSE